MKRVYRRGSRCHNSSVTNGMYGCKSFNPPSRTVYKVSQISSDFVQKCLVQTSSALGSHLASTVSNFPTLSNTFKVPYDINIAKLIEPVKVNGTSRLVKFTRL